MIGCDDREYEVTLTIPYVYRLMAPDAESAKALAAGRWIHKVRADSVGFPEDLRVKEIPATQAE